MGIAEYLKEAKYKGLGNVAWKILLGPRQDPIDYMSNVYE